jgi:hypothetical protein
VMVLAVAVVTERKTSLRLRDEQALLDLICTLSRCAKRA